MGFGLGIFFSPNTSVVKSAVSGERRGIAAVVRTILKNARNIINIGGH